MTGPFVFINYRSGDEPWSASLIDQVLSARFGDDAVFCDHKSVVAGARFDTELLAAVRSCSVLLTVIGTRWLGAVDQHGRRLIDRRGDWVRREIAAAFDVGARVVPVLVGDQGPVAAEALPAGIRALAHCQFLRLRHRDSRADLGRLCAELAEVQAPRAGAGASGRETVDLLSLRARPHWIA